jgi:SagB-type dehydrogenase family enzyme
LILSLPPVVFLAVFFAGIFCFPFDLFPSPSQEAVDETRLKWQRLASLAAFRFMELARKAYQRLLLHRKSRRSFSATAIIPAKVWRGFLEDALNPIWKNGVRLPAAGGFSDYKIILLAQRLAGAKGGTYRVYPAKGRAVRLKRISLDLDLLQRHVCWANQGTTAQATLVIVASGTEIRAKYGKTIGSQLLFQNIGVVQFHLYLTATIWGMGGCAIGWMDERMLGKSIQFQRGDAGVAFTFGL